MTTVTISVSLRFYKTITKNRLLIGQPFDHWCNFLARCLIHMTSHQLFIIVRHITLFRRFRIDKTIFRNRFFIYVAFFTRHQFNTRCFIYKTRNPTCSTRNDTVYLRGYLRCFSRFFQNTLRYLIRITIIVTITISVTLTRQTISRCY